MNRASENLTVAVFEGRDRSEAERLAHELSERHHRVRFPSRTQVMLEANRCRRRHALALAARSITWSVLLAVGLALTSDAILWAAGSRGWAWTVYATALVLAVLTGALAGWIRARLKPSPALEASTKALSQPGRFALIISTPSARRPFVEARIAQSPAVELRTI